MALYTPTIFNYYGGDSARLMRLDFVGLNGMFGDDAQPAGYPLFLAGLRELTTWLPMTIAVQHLLGLAAAALLYASVVRLGAPRWSGLVAAAAVVLSGDQIFLEHGVLTEALWIPLITLAMYFMVRALGAAEPRWWLVAAGSTIAASALARNVSQVLIPLFAVWAVMALHGPLRKRLSNFAAVVLPAVAVVAVYIFVAQTLAGGYSGLVEYRGLQLYGRVAQFADCTRFEVPPAAEPLCIETPPAYRPGPFHWTFGATSPLRASLRFDGHDQATLALLDEFSRRAIRSQPTDYLRVATADILRFIDGDVGTRRPDNGTTPSQMSFGNAIPIAQGMSASELADLFRERYSGVGNGVAEPSARTAMGRYQSVFRTHGALIILLICLAVAGCVLGRRRLQAGAILFLLAGLSLLLLPPLVWSYDIRYSIPPMHLISTAAALGLAVLVRRLSPTDRRTDAMLPQDSRHASAAF